MTIRNRILASCALALICLAVLFGADSCAHRRQEAARLKKAQQLEQSQATHGTEATVHEQEAQDLKPIRWQDDAAVAADRAALARLRPTPARPDPAPAPGSPTPVLVPAPVVVAPLDAAKDKLIDDLTKDLTDTKAALQDMTQADLARQAQVQDLQGELAQLRAIIAARPTPRLWGVGAVYGTNQTAGGYISRDLGLVQLGAQVVRRQLSGGQTTLEALVTAGVRF